MNSPGEAKFVEEALQVYRARKSHGKEISASDTPIISLSTTTSRMKEVPIIARSVEICEDVRQKHEHYNKLAKHVNEARDVFQAQTLSGVLSEIKHKNYIKNFAETAKYSYFVQIR